MHNFLASDINKNMIDTLFKCGFANQCFTSSPSTMFSKSNEKCISEESVTQVMEKMNYDSFFEPLFLQRFTSEIFSNNNNLMNRVIEKLEIPLCKKPSTHYLIIAREIENPSPFCKTRKQSKKIAIHFKSIKELQNKLSPLKPEYIHHIEVKSEEVNILKFEMLVDCEQQLYQTSGENVPTVDLRIVLRTLFFPMRANMWRNMNVIIQFKE